jgi:hypothetical protein
VFLAPPWPEIYGTDPERRHGVGAALAEYSRLKEAYASVGDDVPIMPKVGVVERADLVGKTLTEHRNGQLRATSAGSAIVRGRSAYRRNR